MSILFFTGTQEHVLLALVIKEAQTTSSVKYFGRTALQKVVYFLKALGVPTRYQFEIYHYGPFCDQITSDVELLMADGVIEDKATSPKYWNYALNPTPAASALLASHDEFVTTYSPLVKKVVEVFGGLDPRDLEVYATLHYAYRYESAGGTKPSRSAVIDRFVSYKGNKFTMDQLNNALGALISAKLVATSD